MNRTRIIFFGMDGATWRIMQPLFDQGKLPNLRRLCERGASGVLKSIEPMVSPAIWTSIASGKTPDKHGIWDFVAGSKSVRSKRIWEMADESGLKVGLCGYMVTWPPPVVNGFVIPGSFSRGPETHPASLQVIRELDMSQRSGHQRTPFELAQLAWQCRQRGVRLQTFGEAARVKLATRLKPDFLSKFFQMRRIGLELYTDVFIEQARRFQPDLAMYLFTFVDSTCHNYWKFMEPERFNQVDPKELAEHGDKIVKAYEAADRTIGRTLAALGEENTTVIIVSDHGFQSMPEAQGREPDRTVRIKPETLIELLGWETDSIRTFNIRGSTFFRDRNEREPVAIKMKQDLEAICEVESNQPIFAVAIDPYENVEIRLRDEFERLDTLSIRLPDGRQAAARRIIDADLGTISGDHHPDGVIIAAGPGITRGNKLTEASVLDVTPTILALLGLPVGRDMDGKVLKEMLTREFLQTTPVQYRDSWEEQTWSYEEDQASATEELKEQLRNLGYL